jgi:putative phage-type endonuclease
MSLPTNKQEWLRERKNYLGGSELASICGVSSFGKTALDVYFSKVNPAIVELTKDDPNYEAAYWGTKQEEIIAERYAEERKVIIKTQPALIKHPKYEFIACNIDRWVGNREYILECKTSHFYKMKQWGDSGTDQIPESYLIQVAYYASICDIPKVDIAVLIGGQDFRIYTYNRNKDLEDKIVKIGINFWYNHIEKRIPPKCVNTRDTFNLFPQSNYHEIVAEDNIIEKLEQLKTKKEEESRIQSTIEKLKTDIQEFMRDYDVLIDNQGNVIATWKNTAPKSLVDLKTFREKYREIYEKCIKYGQQSRMFLVK